MAKTVVDRVVEMFLGSTHEREMKRLAPRVAAINALEPEVEPLSDEQLRAPSRRASATRSAPPPSSSRRTVSSAASSSRDCSTSDLGRGLRHRPRGLQAHARDAPLRRPADRRHRPPRRQDRRDEDRRGQDPGRDPAAGPQRPDRARRATSSPSTTTWPAATPSGWAALHASSASPSAASSTRWATPERRRRLPLRHHLRHQQRVRLRLPARQHEVRPRPTWCSTATSSPSSTRSTRS